MAVLTPKNSELVDIFVDGYEMIEVTEVDTATGIVSYYGGQIMNDCLVICELQAKESIITRSKADRGKYTRIFPEGEASTKIHLHYRNKS